MLRGYRGFLRELARTGGTHALALQLRTGVLHVLRRLVPPAGRDPIERFLVNYRADGFRLPDGARAELQLAAEACLVCGLCSMECARVGGAPKLDPRDAVIAASRLEIDWVRLDLDEAVAEACARCSACESVCPARIPIAELQGALASRPSIR